MDPDETGPDGFIWVSMGLGWVQMGSDRFLGRMERGEVASMNSSGIWSGAGRAGGRTRRRRTRLNGELDLRGGGALA
jgi:hypothetical protein